MGKNLVGAECFTNTFLVNFSGFNSIGAKFQTTFVVCFFVVVFLKQTIGKKFICKVELLNVKERRS